MQAAAAFVRVVGPDPRLAKASQRAFHQSEGGLTTISASGRVLGFSNQSFVLSPFVSMK